MRAVLGMYNKTFGLGLVVCVQQLCKGAGIKRAGRESLGLSELPIVVWWRARPEALGAEGREFTINQSGWTVVG